MSIVQSFAGNLRKCIDKSSHRLDETYMKPIEEIHLQNCLHNLIMITRFLLGLYVRIIVCKAIDVMSEESINAFYCCAQTKRIEHHNITITEFLDV